MHPHILLLFTFLCIISQSKAQDASIENELDVLSYHTQIKPDISKKYIEGNVIINFSIKPDAQKVIFNCGSLSVSSVIGESIDSFQQQGGKVFLFLSDKAKGKNEVQLFYHGNPSRGVIFSSVPQQMYTVYFTSEWMICNDSFNDRASIKIDLLLPDSLTCIANGILTNKETRADNLIMYSWNQDVATPTYTYGFSIGTFNKFHEHFNDITLNYYSNNYSTKELETIFGKTADMLSFFEEKSGVQYFQKLYSQILIGNHYQEMSGLAVLKKSYGELVLKDSTETNLISHELAHQWWGNMITCKNLSHFWLNEGFATFMSAAYNEHRFGRDKYLENINSYKDVYEKIKARGGDKSLVFEDWSNASADDRNLVYFKGAYVLHLLREKLGDEAFWKGIKDYSQEYYGKSVTTLNFQETMEKSSNKKLTRFFNKWIYKSNLMTFE